MFALVGLEGVQGLTSVQGHRNLRAMTWDGTLAATHYWDCNGQDCDSKTVPAIEETPGNWAWQPQYFSASPMYAPLDPNDHGGPSGHGEKLWATGAASDALARLLGPDDSRCGESDLSPGGCGKCLLVQNANAVNSDWKVMVMKKHRCPPYSAGCAGDNVHLDIAVPGYDDTVHSTGNVCAGNPNGPYDGVDRLNTFGMTYDSSSSCAYWWDGHDNTQAGCDCSGVTADYGLRAGCELFTEWGWKGTGTATSQQLSYKVVDCPAAFTSIIEGAFSAAGPSSGSSSPAPAVPTPAPPTSTVTTPAPPTSTGDYIYGDACGAGGCSDCDDGCQWSWPSNESTGWGGSNAACRCKPDDSSPPANPTATPGPSTALAQAWGQCGGIQWQGPTQCVDGCVCKEQNDYYSQCSPASR